MVGMINKKVAKIKSVIVRIVGRTILTEKSRQETDVIFFMIISGINFLKKPKWLVAFFSIFPAYYALY